jgi:hypothetical protein
MQQRKRGVHGTFIHRRRPRKKVSDFLFKGQRPFQEKERKRLQ